MFLQHLLPGTTRASDYGLQADQLECWLDALPAAEPVDAARALVGDLVRMRRVELPVRSRIKLLELVRDKAESLLPPIEERLNHATLPLAPVQSPTLPLRVSPELSR